MRSERCSAWAMSSSSSTTRTRGCAREVVHGSLCIRCTARKAMVRAREAGSGRLRVEVARDGPATRKRATRATRQAPIAQRRAPRARTRAGVARARRGAGRRGARCCGRGAAAARCRCSTSASATCSGSALSRSACSWASCSTAAGTAAAPGTAWRSRSAGCSASARVLAPVALVAGGGRAAAAPGAAGAAPAAHRRVCLFAGVTLALAAGTLGVSSGRAPERGGVELGVLLQATAASSARRSTSSRTGSCRGRRGHPRAVPAARRRDPADRRLAREARSARPATA